MTMKNWISGAVVFAVLSPGAILFAQQPVQNIDRQKHPSLAEAQAAIGQAYQKVEIAQRYHKEHLGGHVQKAKDLLAQASQELKMAADYANQHPK
ncbi:MAG: hypothetical protein WA708_13030 [Acidobacteriaceae bacterium]